MPRRNLEALDYAIARTDLAVACLKGTLREAERRAKRLRHTRAMLTVCRGQRRAVA
jgi:hypothetical protein